MRWTTVAECYLLNQYVETACLSSRLLRDTKAWGQWAIRRPARSVPRSASATPVEGTGGGLAIRMVQRLVASGGTLLLRPAHSQR